MAFGFLRNGAVVAVVITADCHQSTAVMRKETSIRQIGNSLGTTFPMEILERLHLEKGVELMVVETPKGLLVTPCDPDFENAMDAYRVGASAYPNVFRELAK